MWDEFIKNWYGLFYCKIWSAAKTEEWITSVSVSWELNISLAAFYCTQRYITQFTTPCTCPLPSSQHPAPVHYPVHNTLHLSITHFTTPCTCPLPTSQHPAPVHYPVHNTLHLSITHFTTPCTCPLPSSQHPAPVHYPVHNALHLSITQFTTPCTCPLPTSQHPAPVHYPLHNSLHLSITQFTTIHTIPSHFYDSIQHLKLFFFISSSTNCALRYYRRFITAIEATGNIKVQFQTR